MDQPNISAEMLAANWPCIKCGAQRPTDRGHDPCIASLSGVDFACCGHGKNAGYVAFTNGTVLRGYFDHVGGGDCYNGLWPDGIRPDQPLGHPGNPVIGQKLPEGFEWVMPEIADRECSFKRPADEVEGDMA